MNIIFATKFAVQVDLLIIARDRDSKNMITYNELTNKKTDDHCKLEDRFQKKAHFSISYLQIRPHIARAACTCKQIGL
jgi:hypothetical protein